MRRDNLSATFLVLAMSCMLIGSAGCDREEEEVPVTPPQTEPVANTPQAAEIDTATKVRFETLVQQVTEHIRKREFDAAETGLRELDKMSATLPESMRQQLVTARAALSAARAGSADPAAAAAPAPATQPR